MPCRFGVDCHRRDCWYSHPAGRAIDARPGGGEANNSVNSASNGLLSASSGGARPGRVPPGGGGMMMVPQASPRMGGGGGGGGRECRYSFDCTRRDCHFSHPLGKKGSTGARELERDGGGAAGRQMGREGAGNSQERDMQINYLCFFFFATRSVFLPIFVFRGWLVVDDRSTGGELHPRMDSKSTRHELLLALLKTTALPWQFIFLSFASQSVSQPPLRFECQLLFRPLCFQFSIFKQPDFNRTPTRALAREQCVIVLFLCVLDQAGPSIRRVGAAAAAEVDRHSTAPPATTA